MFKNSYCVSGKRTALFTAHVGGICLRLCKQLSLFQPLQGAGHRGKMMQSSPVVLVLLYKCLYMYLIDCFNHEIQMYIHNSQRVRCNIQIIIYTHTHKIYNWTFIS